MKLDIQPTIGRIAPRGGNFGCRGEIQRASDIGVTSPDCDCVSLSYLARGLLRDAADDALDALHPHLQLHGGGGEGGVGGGDGDEMGERRRRRRSERRSRCTPAPLLTMIHRSTLTLQASLESEREHTLVNNLLDFRVIHRNI